MKRECETCIKKKTSYCPASMECMATDDMPYYQNRIMLLEENQKLKEEKRLILKDISFWIRNSKVEQIEGDMVHQRYWSYFEDVVNKIFKKYNTENLSDEDLKYNHYLEKENEELIREVQQKEEKLKQLEENNLAMQEEVARTWAKLQQKEDIINKANTYVIENANIYLNFMGNKVGFFKENDGKTPIELLEILDRNVK